VGIQLTKSLQLAKFDFDAEDIRRQGFWQVWWSWLIICRVAAWANEQTDTHRIPVNNRT